MGGSLSEGLRIMAAIVITAMVIGFGFLIWNSTKETANESLTTVTETITQMSEAEVTQYDGSNVTGSQIVNLISQHINDQICIQVDNAIGGGAPCDYCYTSDLSAKATATLKDARDKTSGTYIAPSSKFEGEVMYNDVTGAVIGIKFTRIN